MWLTAIGAGSAAIWLYLILFRGRFWLIEPATTPAAAPPPRSVVAIIPARDEAAVIGGAIASLLAQDYAGRLNIVVIDDHSGDGTAAVIARAAADAANGSGRVTVAAAEPMPAGWTGKLWAVRQGIALATDMRPDYLLLTDADIVHASDNLRGLVARAETGGYDLVSLMVRLHCRGFWERLLVPAFVFFFFMLYPPRWVAGSGGTAAAAGGCMLLWRETLARIGGIDSIRHEIIDDCALARRVKAVGRVWLGAADETRSVRPYGSWRPLWEMIARCAFAQLGYSVALLAGTTAGMAIIYLAPPLLLALSGDPLGMALGGAAWLTMAGSFLPVLRYYRCPRLLAPLLPAIALFYMAATIASAVQFWRGRGGAWKGRYQAASG